VTEEDYARSRKISIMVIQADDEVSKKVQKGKVDKGILSNR